MSWHLFYLFAGHRLKILYHCTIPHLRNQVYNSPILCFASCFREFLAGEPSQFHFKSANPFGVEKFPKTAHAIPATINGVGSLC